MCLQEVLFHLEIESDEINRQVSLFFDTCWPTKVARYVSADFNAVKYE